MPSANNDERALLSRVLANIHRVCNAGTRNELLDAELRVWWGANAHLHEQTEEQRRKAALAKLTPEERKLLNL
jgi:hypothetical protein